MSSRKSSARGVTSGDTVDRALLQQPRAGGRPPVPAAPLQRWWRPSTWAAAVQDTWAILSLALQLLIAHAAVVAAAYTAKWVLDEAIGVRILWPMLSFIAAHAVDALYTAPQKTLALDLCIPSNMAEAQSIDWAERWPICKGILSDFLVAGTGNATAFTTKHLSPTLAVWLFRAWTRAGAAMAVALAAVAACSPLRGQPASAATAVTPGSAWRAACASMLATLASTSLAVVTFMFFLLPLPWTLPGIVSYLLVSQCSMAEGLGPRAALRRSAEVMAPRLVSCTLAYVTLWLLSWPLAAWLSPLTPPIVAEGGALGIAISNAAKAASSDLLRLAAYLHLTSL